MKTYYFLVVGRHLLPHIEKFPCLGAWKVKAIVLNNNANAKDTDFKSRVSDIAFKKCQSSFRVENIFHKMVIKYPVTACTYTTSLPGFYPFANS